MRKCYLHIGSHKTGTSAIQKSLADNAEKLKQNNCFYSNSCRHVSDHSSNPIALAIVNKDPTTLSSLMNKLQAEIDTMSGYDMILSSEILEKCPKRSPELCSVFMQRLASNFDEIEIIYSLRDPYALCNSIFKQFVSNAKQPYSGTINHFINSVFVNSINTFDIISSWSSAPSTTKISAYWYSNSFDDNFQNIAKACHLNFKAKNPGIINRSIDGVFLAINYYYNTHYHLKKTNDQFISALKTLSYSCKDEWYFKTSIIEKNEIDNFQQLTSEYGKVPSYVNMLNDRIEESKKDLVSMPSINDSIEFFGLLKEIQTKFNIELVP